MLWELMDTLVSKSEMGLSICYHSTCGIGNDVHVVFRFLTVRLGASLHLSHASSQPHVGRVSLQLCWGAYGKGKQWLMCRWPSVGGNYTEEQGKQGRHEGTQLQNGLDAVQAFAQMEERS